MTLDLATAELTIDELARETGMTVRNIRSHASRGLLQPPIVRARTGYYGPEHVARLRLIQELQANGYNLAAIKHLLGRGDGSAEQVLGFARSLLAPFEVERPEVVDAAELAAKWGASEVDPKLVARAEKLGLVAPLGDGRYEIPSPTLVRAGEELISLGIPLDHALAVAEEINRHARAISRAFLRLYMQDVVGGKLEAKNRTPAEWERLRHALSRLSPLATEAVRAGFQQTMSGAVEREIQKTLER